MRRLLVHRYPAEWAAVLAVSIIWADSLRGQRGGQGTAQAISEYGLAVVALAAGVACLATARRTRNRARAAWSLLGCSSLFWAVGQTLWAWHEVTLQRPLVSPSYADLSYLAAVPLAVAGLICLPSAASRLAGHARTLLDGLIIAASLMFISWVVVLGPLFHSEAAGSPDRVISMAHLVADVVVASVALSALVRSRRGVGLPLLPLACLAAGFVAISIGDSGFAFLSLKGRYDSSSLVNAGWFLGYALIYLAARTPGLEFPSVTQDEDRPHRFGLLLPLMAALLALLTGVALQLRGNLLGPFLVWNLVLLLILVVCRQLFTLLENVSLTRNLEERVRVRTSELHQSEARFRALVQNSSDVVVIVNADGTIRYVSPAVRRIFGYAPPSLLGTSLLRLVAESEVTALLDGLEQVCQRPLAMLEMELSVSHANGETRLTETTVTNLSHEPSVGGLVLNMHDISERKALEEQLLHQAFHDALTKLANRALFKDRLHHAMAQGERRSNPIAVLFLDLDGFKEINDSLGHSYGDAMLVEVGERLRKCVRPGDTVARLGGDEFAVLLEQVEGQEEAAQVADRITAALAAPMELHNRRVTARASIGIAVATGTESHQDLLRNADLAMYQAKAAGEGRQVTYEPGMHSTLVQRLQTEEDLRYAVARGELVLHYQPTVQLRDGRLVGAEALLRWNHPTRGLISPGEFVSLAEETGFIVPIGNWVLREACAQAQRWREEQPDGPAISVAVNLSPLQLRQPDLTTAVAVALRASGLPATSLVLEMTESILIEHTDDCQDTLVALREMGVRLAIDDFGTGYSSLSYLHRFPLDILKIDRSFVDRLGAEVGVGADQTELAGTIVRLGQSLGLTTVAEGIERADQLAALTRMGCDIGQGYYFSKPVPSSVISRLLATGCHLEKSELTPVVVAAASA